VYPALAVFQALSAKHTDVEILWVGGESGMEAQLVKRAGLPYTSIRAGGVHGVSPRVLLHSLAQLTSGFFSSRKILQDFQPDVLFFTGGYLAGPMAFAGRAIPTLLYVPDIEPGLALKSLSRFADRITVSAEDSQKYFTQEVLVTGYPIRSEIKDWTKKTGRTALKLENDLPVLLVAGGSKGARTINQALVPNLPTLLDLTQVVHLTGQLDWEAVERVRSGLTSAQKKRYHIFPYLHEKMGAALAAADLVVARAGASTLGEFPFFGLPAILVPYPYAWRYQKVNADYLAQRGAAILVRDELLQTELLTLVKDLLNNPSKRQAMRTAMKSLVRPKAAEAIAEQLFEMGGQR
jgi:UDP-N-acetylglucosamine--N-acetylmuramyl-(pentapeptide) pyrophosphoryl-undecaprenol N-acetylglucosamine transferase